MPKRASQWPFCLFSNHFSQRLSFFTVCRVSRTLCGNFLIWVSRYLENAYPTHFLTSKDTLFIADEHDFSAWVLGFHNKVHEIVSPKSVQISAQYRFHTPSCTNSTPLFQKPYTSKPPLWLFDTFSTRKM